MTTSRLHLCVLLTALSISGCEGYFSPPPPPPVEPLPQRVFEPIARYARYYGAPEDTRDPNPVSGTDERLMLAHLKALEQLGCLPEPDHVPTERELGRYAQLLADHGHASYAFLIEQTIAFQILATAFPAEGHKVASTPTRQPLTPDDLKAISFATRLMLKNLNPNADLLAAALQALNGHWSDEEIRDGVFRALDGVAAWQARRCPECNPDSAVKFADTANNNRDIEILRAALRLAYWY